MMTPDEFKIGDQIIWDSTLGVTVTTDQELSEKLAEDLRSGGVKVTRVGRKPRSRNKYILFTIEVVRIKGLDMMFLSEEEAQAWHQAKNRSLRTLMKAPEEAFAPVETEKQEEMIWWSQAYKLAYRLGGISQAKDGILRKRGVLVGSKYGL
jgi:hypothetical protein